jgi:hypothetical protein
MCRWFTRLVDERLQRIKVREHGLSRLRTLRRAIAVSATLLAGLLALVTAATATTKKIVRAVPTTRTRVVRHQTARRVARIPQQTTTQQQTQQQATPAPQVQAPVQTQVQAPVQTQVQPVVVSGGS